MIEIIPNWHPIFVHYTLALVSVAFIFYLAAYLVSLANPQSYLAREFEIVSRWSLWFGGIITIATAAAGLYAAYTVQVNDTSLQAILAHRNWAVPTVVAILLVTIWSMIRKYRQKPLSILFLIALLIVQGLVVVTAWHGSEVVYRYGVGVMSPPNAN